MKVTDSQWKKGEDRPLTAEEQVAKIVEEIGDLTATYDEKFEAIRSLVPKDAPEMETLDDGR